MRPTIRKETPDQHVFELVRLLITNGHKPSKVAVDDGIFDSDLENEVRLFQNRHQDMDGRPLEVDGIVGRKTWWALANTDAKEQRSGLAERDAGLPTTDDGLLPLRRELLALCYSEHSKDVKEVPNGSNRSPEIDKYWGRTGVIGAPWCCAFANWALHAVLGRFPINGKHHLSVMTMVTEARAADMLTNDPKPGDLFAQDKGGWKGHTGVVVGVSEDGATIYTCEGNAGNRLKLGRRPRGTIDFFIDPFQDGQDLDFRKGADWDFTDTSGDTDR